MKAIVVYESHWGNTAAIARAIAEGIGTGAQVFSTAEATSASIAGADLIVTGAPLLGFALPTESMLKGISDNAARETNPPDMSHPSMRSWLGGLAEGNGFAAAFETRIWWSPGSAAKEILRQLKARGYVPIGKAQRFIVEGKYGPLREGEVEKARAWGVELARMTEERRRLETQPDVSRPE